MIRRRITGVFAARVLWIIWASCVLHLVWGLMLLVNADPYGATPLSTLHGLPHLVGGIVFIGIAACSAWALLQPQPSRWTLVALMPQQMTMVMSAIASAAAIAGSHYADGVQRPFFFIAADQALVVIMGTFHALAVIHLHYRAGA